MTWLDRVRAQWHAIKAPPAERRAAPASGARLPLAWDGWSDRGGTDLGLLHASGAAMDEGNARTAASSVWVYACCQAIAGEISAARLIVRRRAGDEGEEDIDNHPWEQLWEQPNPFMGRAFLMQFWAWNLLLRGEAYLYVRPVRGELAEIWPVPSWAIDPIPHPEHFISGYAFRPRLGGEPILIEPRYIVYSRLPNPFDVRRGLSPLAAAMGAVHADLAMRRWNVNFFSRENAAPTGIISVPRDTLDADLVRIRQEIADFFGDGTRRVGVARAGDLAWMPFDRSQKDMEFLQGREFSRTEISRAFGIPDGYWDKDATRANAEGARATMIETAVWPKLELLAEDLNAQIAPVWIGDAAIRIAFEDIRPRNIGVELRQLATYAPYLTINEARALAGYDHLPDYRGRLTLDELRRGAPMPMTAPGLELEDLMAAYESGTPVPTTPAEAPAAAAEPAPPALVEQEIAAWRRKAIKAWRAGKRAAVAFRAQAIPAERQARIRERLAGAGTLEAIKAAFDVAGLPPDLPEVDAALVDRLIEETLGDALRWAALAADAAHADEQS